MIQNIYKCVNYTPNENLNKTCDNCKRCCIYYGLICSEYEVNNNDKYKKLERKSNKNKG